MNLGAPLLLIISIFSCYGGEIAPYPERFRSPAAFVAKLDPKRGRYVIHKTLIGSDRSRERLLKIINHSEGAIQKRLPSDFLIVTSDLDVSRLGAEWKALKEDIKDQDLTIFYVKNGICKTSTGRVNVASIVSKQ